MSFLTAHWKNLALINYEVDAKILDKYVPMGTKRTFSYHWQNDNQWNSIQLETKLDQSVIELNSEAEFITEHYFAYTKYDENMTFEYEVTHPRWEQFEIINYKIEVDFENNYGKDFIFLNETKPISVFLAKGSKITVENKKKIRL